jgi:hypothetical protein
MRLVISLMSIAFALDLAAAQRGAIAFHYATPLTPAQLEWYSRFDLLVTHDPLPRPQREALRARGTKLLLYEWAVAFYGTRRTPWHKRIPSSALLNTRPLRGHLGSATADAFYYDPFTREHERDRAAKLIARLRNLGYDGIFFDTTTSESVHPEALAEYNRRHPDTPYDVAFARFLRTLRREWRQGIIATNQGYRAATHVMPYVDVDVTESLITRPVQGRFVFRPWNDPHDGWNSTAFLLRTLIEPVQRDYPRVKFVHVNYLDAPDAASAERIVAIARLFGAEAYVTNPELTATVEAPYFVDLGAGKPRVESGSTAYRIFEHGWIAVNMGSRAMRVQGTTVAPGSVVLQR